MIRLQIRSDTQGNALDIVKAAIAAEDLEERDQEYIEWAGELKIRGKIAGDLQKLKTIEYVAH